MPPSFPREFATPESGRIAGHIAAFVEALRALGYADVSRRRKHAFVKAFAHWVDDGGTQQTPSLDEAILVTYLQPAPDRSRGPRSHEHVALRQFLEFLRSVGAAPPSPASALSSDDVLVGRYVEHLRHARGLTEHSIAVYAPLVRAFVSALQLGDGLDATLDVALIRGFLVDRAHVRSSEYTRLLAVAMRSFLRFLFLHGETATDLSAAVPPVRRWQFGAIPPSLSPEDVEHVLAAPDRTTPEGRRARAMLLLLARLGLRAGEVVTLDLDDLHWSTGEIVVRGKGRYCDRLPLLDDVGEALALYLQHDRGSSASRRVFLRLLAPREGLSGPSAVSCFVRCALERAGLRPPGRVGAHIFRHSLATHMIRRGASLAEISQALRHRCLEATRLYAKVDLDALRGVARPWPSVDGPR